MIFSLLLWSRRTLNALATTYSMYWHDIQENTQRSTYRLRWGMVDKGNVRFVPIGAACVLLEATRFDDQYAGGLADRNLNSVSPDLRL